VPQETSPSKPPVPCDEDEVFWTEPRPGGKFDFYCAVCKKGPFKSSHGFKIHLTKTHKKQSKKLLDRRYVELRTQA
jgi:hypothetical protein